MSNQPTTIADKVTAMVREQLDEIAGEVNQMTRDVCERLDALDERFARIEEQVRQAVNTVDLKDRVDELETDLADFQSRWFGDRNAGDWWKSGPQEPEI